MGIKIIFEIPYATDPINSIYDIPGFEDSTGGLRTHGTSQSTN